jgi:hypothetical protein
MAGMKLKEIFVFVSLMGTCCVPMLVGASGSSSPACEGKDYEVASAELSRIHDEDQEDRSDFPWSETEIREVLERDEARRVAVAKIFAEGCLKSADDYLRASVVFQHGVVPDHYFQAYIWASRAFDSGRIEAGTMIGNGVDRYLMHLGQKQLFGGQAQMVTEGPEARSGCFCLWPVEPSFPDSIRDKYHFKTRAEIQAWLESLNQGKAGCSSGTCQVEAKPVHRGSIPGLW